MQRANNAWLSAWCMRGLWGCALACLWVAGVSSAGALKAAADEGERLVVIAPKTGITELPSNVLRDAYLGLRTEHQGVRLIPFNAAADTPIRRRMDRVLLGLEPGEVGRFWVNQRVRDGRKPPRTVPSTELAVRVVAQLAGAIACVPQSAVDSHVRAVRIDGKGPADRDYLLAPR